MRINHYPQTDTLYIELRDKLSVKTVECAKDIVIDVDVDGNAVGIEIEHASEKTDPIVLQSVSRIGDGFPMHSLGPTNMGSYRMTTGMSVFGGAVSRQEHERIGNELIAGGFIEREIGNILK